MWSVEWAQKPVGHGGFHTGRLTSDDGAQFNWIFDCGSQRTKRFNDFLLAWTNNHQHPVDWLFISHFDKDHVSGLETLMARAVIREVMVPYVNDRELAYLLLYEIDRGRFDRSFVELVADPAAFFLSRGADRVVFLGSDQSREDGEFRRPKRSRPDGVWGLKIHPDPRPIRGPIWAQPTLTNESPVQIVDSQDCNIAVARSSSFLRFKPYRAPVPKRNLRGIISALTVEVGFPQEDLPRPGLGNLAYAIARAARNAIGRARLRRIFEQHIASSNRSSLSLLSIPELGANSKAVCRIRYGAQRAERAPFRPDSARQPAWLNTGDAELLKKSDLENWRDAYLLDLKRVRVLALPHHGSDKNSDSNLQSLCPSALLAVHTRLGSTKHPGDRVLAGAADRLVCVTEDPTSELQMRLDVQ